MFEIQEAGIHTEKDYMGTQAVFSTPRATMNRHVLEISRARGWLEILRSAGVSTVADTCVYWRPGVSGLTGRVMISSGKFAYYAPGELDIEVAIGSLRECVESAILGKVWRDPELELS